MRETVKGFKDHFPLRQHGSSDRITELLCQVTSADETLRIMQYLITRMSFEIRILHIPGKTNELADLLSRDRLNVAQAKGY